MSKSHSKTVDIISTIIAGVIIIGLGVWLLNGLGGGEKKDEPAKVAKNEVGDSFERPIAINTDSLNMSGQEFADKYKDKWVSFDGRLGSTIAGDPAPHTVVRIGDDELSTFSDGSLLYIMSFKMTFNDNLQEYASEYTPASTPKVHVVAQVTGYSNSNVSLKPHSNADGKSPSVTGR